MILHKLKKYLFALILLSSYLISAEIIEVESLNKIEQDFEEIYSKNYLPQDILVVVDLDKLLFKSFFPSSGNIDQTDALQIINIFQKIRPTSKELYLDQVLLTDYKQELLNSSFPDFIKNFIDKRIPIIAINNYFTGNYNNIPKFEIWFADYLKKNFNIDFSRSFPSSNYLIFNNLESFNNTYPVFYKGILTSNNISKSSLILNFILEVKLIPKAVILISSNKDLLNSMDIQLKSYSTSIEYISYYYDSEKKNNNNFDMLYYTKFSNEVVNKINKLRINNPPLNKDKKLNKDPYEN